MANVSQQEPKLRIALVCDFFYPRLGGVEMHIWSLAQLLIRQGHKVIVITHAYGDRKGVRYLPGPLKVYYCPIVPMVDQDALPSFTATLPLLRWIWIREQINVVHAHQATSTMGNESLVYASTLGIPTVYTDHSLFGFDDVASLVLNRVLQTTLSTANAIICVSYTCRDNLVLRARIDNALSRTYVIPNAVDPSKFTPDPSKRTTNGRIKVVVVSRLVYRKGVDLLVGIIPVICKQLPQVDFILGGDGAKRLALEEMVERERLQERVEFLGAVPHKNVRNVLATGHVFLNCSLTESFCIALLEAASCGLLVVSTNVGGVPEVLPTPDVMLLSEPNVPSLVQNLKIAIDRQEINPVDPWEIHNRVKKMYSWSKVAKETTAVYNKVLAEQQHNPKTFLQRMECYSSIGGIAGWVAFILALLIHFWAATVEWWQPREHIDVVPDLQSEVNKTEESKF
mmetsp:Transcript_14241/g.20038  ORF Transcript_14241/g.20038 Transcript_14241/m.20038 type:complete len:454 (+) Transcript_14241:392-1753(+)